MAGIGFEFRKYLKNDSFSGTFKAYGFAGHISAGPWVLSIVGVMQIGVIALIHDVGTLQIRQFTTSVTWIMGASLVLTGLLQLVFTRFIADQLYKNRLHIINANLFGALLLTTVVSAVISLVLALTLFEGSFAYELLLSANFVTLANVWIVVIFISGMKRFKLILFAFAIAYTSTVALSFALIPFGLDGLLTGLLVGHSILLFLMLAAVLPEYPVTLSVRFDFLRRSQIFPGLIAVGFFYNLGIWVDKLIFWLSPATSDQIIGPLSNSIIYDLPIFLAYLSIIPGMTVFLLRSEAEFVQAYNRIFAAIKGNAGLSEIESLGDKMVVSVRDGIFQIVRIQGATILILYLMGPTIIGWLGISSQYVQLYYINLVGVGAQVLILAVLTVLFYLDKRRQALTITATLLLSNSLFTWLSIELGSRYYGDGFGLSMTLTALFSLVILSRELENIEYQTFMKQTSVTSGAV